MAEYAALPLFTDALMADCSHLSDERFGQYLRLLILMWRSPGCRVPNDDQWLANKLGRDLVDIEHDFRPLIVEFCRGDGNWIWQKRLTKEFKYVTKQRKLQSERAKARWEKEKADASADAGSMPQPKRRHKSGNAPSPSPSPSPSSEKKEGARERAGNGEYAFVGEVIRLLPKDLDQWRQAYHAVPDIIAELRTADAYYRTTPPKDGKWYFAASAWLKREHDKRMAEADAERRRQDENDPYRGAI